VCLLRLEQHNLQQFGMIFVARRYAAKAPVRLCEASLETTMNRNCFIALLVIAGLLAAVAPADAHHSWQLDRSKLYTLSGTVARFDFANPHVQLYFQVKEDNGTVDTWQAGGPSPNQLSRGGWSKDTLKLGEQVTVAGYRNKDGSKILRFDTITLPGGQVLQGYQRGYRGR
jgi:hypothetical protein